MILSKIIIPMLNANEPEATLVEILIQDGNLVKMGDLLFTIETTKAASDIEAEADGTLRVVASAGTTMMVGDVIGYIISEPNEPIPVEADKAKHAISDVGTSEIRITEPARKLALQSGIALASLPNDRLVTEAMVKALIASSEIRIKFVDTKKIFVYGAGGHAKAIMEMIIAIGSHEIIGIIDDDPALTGEKVLGYSVIGIGNGLVLGKLRDDGVGLAANGVGGIININVRKNIFDRLEENGFLLPALCHPKATIEESAIIQEGVQVFANAYVGSSVILRTKCMINTGAIISHDCVIGELSHIAPGAMLAGGVTVGKQVLVGMGVTTAIGIKLGDGTRIGNGSSILKDVPAKTIIPAGKVWN